MRICKLRHDRILEDSGCSGVPALEPACMQNKHELGIEYANGTTPDMGTPKYYRLDLAKLEGLFRPEVPFSAPGLPIGHLRPMHCEVKSLRRCG